MSNFFYIHKDLSGKENCWKIGVAITPYSAVRARQKYCWNDFTLDYVYFGTWRDITWMERHIKSLFYGHSAKYITGKKSRSEMFKVNIDYLRDTIAEEIKKHKLKVMPLELPNGYSASSASMCPLKLPSEAEARGHCQRLCEQYWKQT